MEERRDSVETAPRDANASTREEVERPGNIHGVAVRSLISRLQNGPQMSIMKEDQSATLDELKRLGEGIDALNKESAEAYSALAPEFIRAARLAAQVKSDLNDISRRMHSVQTKINELHALQQNEHQDDAQ